VSFEEKGCNFLIKFKAKILSGRRGEKVRIDKCELEAEVLGLLHRE